MKHSRWLVIYDICNPKRLREVEKIVSRYGIQVQKSVFELDVNENLILSLQHKLEGVVGKNDSAAIIPLCEGDWQKVEKYGIMKPNSFINGAYEIL